MKTKHIRRTAGACCLSVAALATTLSSQEEPQQTPQRTVKAEITVTSSLPELNESEAVEPRELETRGANDLVEGLRSTAGIDAVRRGPVNLEPTVRGLQEGQLGLFVNGTRTFAAGPGRMDSDLSHVSLHDVQALEVVKGPYALSWGAGTLSAIDARTFRPDFTLGEMQLGARAFGSFESNRDASDAFGRLSGSSSTWRFTVSAGAREGSDYEDGDGALVPADYSSDTLGGSVAVQWGQALLEYDGAYQGQDDIDYAGRFLDATYFKTRSHRLSLSWSGSGRLNALSASVYSNAKDHLMNNDEKPTALDNPNRLPPFALDVDLPTESNTLGGAVRADFGLGEHTGDLSVGLDVYRVDQIAERFIRRRSNGFLIVNDFAWPETDLENLGLWAQWRRSLPRATFGAALRLDANRSEFAQVSDFFAQVAGSDLDRSEDAVSAAVSGSLQLSDTWTVHGGLGRAVRNPSTLELYSDRFPATKFQIRAEFVGDPNLGYEASHELNAGVIGSWGSLVLRADGFYRTIDDYITVAADPSLPKKLPGSFNTVYRYVNGDEARFWGGELRLDHRVSPNVSWRLQLDSTRGTDETFDEPVLGLTPARAIAAVRLSTPSSRLWLDVEGVHLEDQDRVATARFEQPTEGADLLHLALGTRWTSGLELTLFARNLTDESYANHLNAPNPFNGLRVREIGRSVGVTVRYTR